MQDTASPAPRGARELGIALLAAAALIVLYRSMWFINRNFLAAAHTNTYYYLLRIFE